MRRKKSMYDAVERMRQDITISLTHANGFYVSFTYENAALAQGTNSEVIARLMDEHVLLGQRTWQLLDMPSLPWRPTGPNRAGVTALGLSGGLMVGGVVALARRRMAQRSA